nr:hypothetical protein [Geodermatophilus normandii]
MLGDDQHRAAPLTAEREALHQAQDDEQHGGEHADRRVGGQQADQERGPAHHQQRHDQQLLAADAVAEVPEDERADGPGEEADGVGGEGRQGPDEVVLLGEEQVAEHERGGRAVEEEVVPLDGGADDARADDTAEAPPLGRLAGSGHAGLLGGRVRSASTLGRAGGTAHVPEDSSVCGLMWSGAMSRRTTVAGRWPEGGVVHAHAGAVSCVGRRRDSHCRRGLPSRP